MIKSKSPDDETAYTEEKLLHKLIVKNKTIANDMIE
jgi:hypothetical protein